ncbi:hypothetical protein E4U56_003314 [Claviceps arundinis]|uniref:Uncharacterized protein n=1 Tax=Claviceps arundinis TaxID=1623583 RepID=A0A9P7MPW7_9HYPO|nr:hypothetical protein E4U56_003314 [Claviceps arundinis]
MAVQDKLAPPGLNTAPARLQYLRAEAVDKRAMLVLFFIFFMSLHGQNAPVLAQQHTIAPPQSQPAASSPSHRDQVE